MRRRLARRRSPATRTDPETDDTAVVLFGRVSWSIASSDAIGCVRKYVDSLDLFADRQTTKRNVARQSR
jgi:hypothetical protein